MEEVLLPPVRFATSAFLMTHIAAATATLSWLIVEWKTPRQTNTSWSSLWCRWQVLLQLPRHLVLLVRLLRSPIGFGAGAICYLGVNIKNFFGYDDSLDAVGVHGVGGTFGALATGLFASKAINAAGADGAFFGNPSLFLIQLLSVAVAIVYAFSITWIILKVLDRTMGLRVQQDEEVQGLDLSQHGESGLYLLIRTA